MGRELAYLSSHATNRYFIPNCGIMFNFDNYSLLMCPAASLVLEFLIATDIFLGLCIFCLNLTYQVGRQLVEFLITRQSCYKAHLVLLGSPGNNLMATEHGQSCHRWLRCQWYVVGSSTDTHFQNAVMAEVIAIICILKTCCYLINTLSCKLWKRMNQ